MKTTKYKATVIGVITTGICGFISLGAFLVPALSVFSIVFILPVLPLEYVSGWIFGENNYPMKLIGILFMETILLLVLCYWYFRKLIRDRKKSEKFNGNRLLIFFLLLQFIIHPIGFYIWLLVNPKMDPNDGMIIFYMIETLPFSGFVFMIMGVIVDLIRNWKEKGGQLTSSLDSQISE